MDTVVWLGILSFVLLVNGRPHDIDEGVAENFLSSGQRTAEDLIHVREKLQLLSNKTRRSWHGLFKRNFVLFNHDDSHTSNHPSLSTVRPFDEATINKNLPISDYLYQGDIALTEAQLDARLNSRSKRSAVHDGAWPHTKWDPKHVPYYFDPNFPTQGRARVREAMDFWEKYTCVRFKEDRKSQPTLRIHRGGGCWSYIGRQKTWKVQDLSIAESCERNFGVITHELMHSLGFYHEHARADRDNYITVNMNNIHPNETNQFTKETGQDSQGFPYEYGSVMHYASNYMAVDDNIPVFVSKDPNYATTMGQRMKPSFQDIQQVNDLYKCWLPCDNSGTECGNGGLANVNNCSECFCPYGFAGKYCFDLEKPTPKNSKCGEVVQAEVGTWKKLTGFVDSGIPDNSRWLTHPESCWWHIKAPEGKRVAAKFTSIGATHCSKGCSFGHLEVKTGQFRQTGYRLCCPHQTQVVYNSTGKTMAIGANVLLYTVNFELEYTAY